MSECDQSYSKMTAKAPQPLAALKCRDLVGIFTDIDDTLTTDGRLHADAFAALWQLHSAGFAVVPVTGRSAGWAHMILKSWPVSAVIAESGGVYLSRAPNQPRTQIVLHSSVSQVRADRAALEQCGQQIIREIPGLACASDNAFRWVDYALDYCEEVARVDASDVDRAIAMFQAQGFSARASSVHINAWRGDFDKAPMAMRLLREQFATGGRDNPDRWLFIGDAPNDASMFASFANSVAVANILPSLANLPVKPAYITQASHGAGFVELGAHILRQLERP